MNLRVLVYMNPLAFNKISKKFLPEKDSGFLYTKQLIESLPTCWRFTILVPKGVTTDFFGDTHVIECVEYDYATSIHQNRYHFNRNIISKAFSYTKDVDVIINNQPEVAANLKVFFKVQRREYPLIINLYHWIDCKESARFASDLSGFIYRQVEGFNIADLNLFHNQHALDLFTQSVNDNNLPLKTKTTGFFHPQPTTFGEEPIELPDKKIILFNHRLNNTTGWQEIVKICKNLREDRLWGADDFVLWITDENIDEHTDTHQDWIITQNLPFENYGYLLKNSHFSICNVKAYGTWNMSLLDSLHYGTPVIAPNTPLMNELGADTTDNLPQLIEEYITTPKKTASTKTVEDFVYVDWIHQEITSRIEGKNPKKYDQVKEYINNTTKKDFVNYFWKFHANSNFQKIRWKLLLDGFIDDVSCAETTYYQPNTQIEEKQEIQTGIPRFI